MRRFLFRAVLGVALTFGAVANPGGAYLGDSGVNLFASLQQQNHSVDPALAWMLAAGFLGVVVLRRTRSGPMI
jgi:hypothetical protein